MGLSITTPFGPAVFLLPSSFISIFQFHAKEKVLLFSLLYELYLEVFRLINVLGRETDMSR